MLRAVAMAGEDTAIGLWRFFADDLDRVEIIAEARLRELALLVEEVALGDEDDAVGARQRSSVSCTLGRVSTGFCSIWRPKLRISAITEGFTCPPVTSSAVSIMER
jgi:hypothetical protein